MNEKEIKQLNDIFEAYPEIKLVYLFGSTVRNERGPMSDFDFAVYLDERNGQKISDIQFELMDKISRLFKTDAVDVVMLDRTKSPEIKYNIIKEGEIIFEREPYRVLFEPKVLNEYFDFYMMLKKHNLTKA